MSRCACATLVLAALALGGLAGCEAVLGLEPAQLDPLDAGADASATDGSEPDGAADGATDGPTPDGREHDSGLAVIASMSVPRASPLAIVLKSNRVLVAFGYDEVWNPIGTAEIYDPALDSWSAPEDLEHGGGPDGTLLQDGRVLIPVNYTDYTTFYDPAQPAGLQWTSGPSLTTIRDGTTTVTLANGKALVIGDTDDASADLYDASLNGGNGGFTRVAMSLPRRLHTATVLADGRVLVVGGDPCGATTAQSEIYDPVDNAFHSGPALNTPRVVHQAFLLADGRVLIVGGDECGGLSSAKVEIFDPTPGSEAFTTVHDMYDDRDKFGGSALGGGDPRVIVTGGETHTYFTFGRAEIYDPTVGVGGTWTRLPDLPAPRSSTTTVRLPDGSVLFLGGQNYQASTTTVYADGLRFYP